MDKIYNLSSFTDEERERIEALINQKRFGYSDDLKSILKNTVDFLIGE